MRAIMLVLLGLLSVAPAWMHAAPAGAEDPKAATTTEPTASATSSDPAIEQAQSRLQKAQQRIAAAQNLLKNGANELAQLNQQLSTQTNPPDIAALDIPALEALQQQLHVAEQDATHELQIHQHALDALEQPQPPVPAPIVPPASTNPSPAAQKLRALQTEADNAEAQARAIEISVQPLAIQLAQARVKLSQSQRNQARTSLAAIDTRLSELRLADARASLRATDSNASYARDPRLKSLVDVNENLAQTLIKLTESLDQLTQQNSQINAQTESMRSDMALLQRQLQQFGFGPIMGKLLLAKRATLPTESELAIKSQDNRDLLGHLQLLDIKLREEHQALLDPSARIKAILAALPKDDSDDQAKLQADVSTLIDIRLDLLPKLEALKPQILQAIASKEEALAAQSRELTAFQDFIKQNLLWLPNERVLWEQPPALSWLAIRTMFSVEAWQGLMQQQADAIRSQPLLPALGFGLIVALVNFRRRMKLKLRSVLDSADHNSFKVLPSSVEIIFLALLLALPFPLLLLGLALILNASPAPTALSSSLASALSVVAPLWLNARLFMLMTQPNGLAEKLFKWHVHSLVALRRAFRGYLYFVIPLAFLTTYMLTFCSKAQLDAGSGQVVFIGLLLCLAFIFARLMRPQGALVRHWHTAQPKHGLARFAGWIFWFGIGLFLVFIGMVVMGYTFSAGILVKNLSATLWVLLGLSMIKGFAQIALQQVYRRIAVQRLEQAQQTRQALAPQEHDHDSELLNNRSIITPDTPIDMSEVNQQSQKLLGFSLNLGLLFALYFVWAPILPALTLFDQVSLWDVQTVVDGNTVSSAVSLGDALMSGLLLIAMWVAARNLPGLMEIVLAQWTHHDAGTRYAIVSILRYLIIGAGIIIFLGGLGVQWSQLQWLVAALGVGIGFGLQEIFANFISGIIILLERPVRVGDLVTVGSNTGFIRRIHIRSTVLEDYDRKEIIVPNKTLITGEVINWTLTDTTARVLIDVGVAYGSDTRLVERLLLEAATKVPRLMTDPAPIVWFVSFGDNALNFRLRGYVENADIKLGVTSELNYIIEQTLREHDINIPFPQRDVHLTGLEELTAAVRQSEADAPRITTEKPT